MPGSVASGTLFINERAYYLGCYLYLIFSKFNLVNHALDRGQMGGMLDVCVCVCVCVFVDLQILSFQSLRLFRIFIFYFFIFYLFPPPSSTNG